MLLVVIIKSKTKSLLPLEEFDMSMQEYNINRDHYIKCNNLRGQFLLFS